MGLKLLKYKIKTSCFCKDKNIVENYIEYNEKPTKETYFGIAKRDYYRSYNFCFNCKHFFAKHKFDLQELYQRKYSTFSYGTINKINKNYFKIINLPKKKSDNKNRFYRLKKYIKKDFLSLDIGSGLGVFPYEFQKRGIKIDCVEKDVNLVSHLKKHKFNLISNDLFKIKIKNYYNFVSINKVLEHLEKPGKFLKKAFSLTKKNGYLYIELPSTSALKDIKEGKLREEFFIEHFHIFSKKSLLKMFVNYKIKIIFLRDIIEPSGKYSLVGLFKKI